MTEPYQMAREFHKIFAPEPPEKPTAFSIERGSFRAGFKAEEIVEFLYGAAQGDEQTFHELVGKLHESIDQAQEKVLAKAEVVEDPLIAEVDALTDLLYFTYGSFALIGVDPQPIFEIVHRANLGKLFPDGKPRYHPVTNKVLKPEDWQKNYAPEPLIKKELDRQKGKADSF
ncbi:HAD family hydrolase [Enterococcus dongliensis]|uniref:HAD family hydrolase n=1 Tax=Enterococcus dongliensis TaxID=2559925 RepID=UPI00288C8469|nr:HAD family hydrolase [Enterococcus dongliensis]MDT2612624.1 HAD family hydrolase [Enterococcus dongliensis]MDT2639056.1 HAD family hydrolase [Enterococcus dongliensis]